MSFDSAENTISAIVKGGEKYKVRIFPENGEISGFCTSPYGDVCKHITAVLVDKYSPSQYRTEIINRNSGKPEAKAIFRKTRNKIENLFQDAELLFFPSEFEGTLINNLNKLKGFESHLKDEIGKLILFIIEEVNSAFDSGYLYLEDYRGDDFFEEVEFCDFVAGFVRHLEFIEKIEFLQDLDESLNCMEYSTF